MTGGPPRARLDPTDPTFSADPFPRYAALRSEGPAVAVDLPNGRAAWVVTSYEHARAVLSDRRMLAAPPERDRGPARCDLESHMLNADGPEHARLRRLVSGALGRSAVAALRPRIAALVDSLLDDMAAAGTAPVDLVDALAFPLPVLVVCEVLGVPVADRQDLRRWTYVVSAPAAASSPEEVSAAWAAMHRYFTDLVAATRCQPPGDALLSRLVHPGDPGDELDTPDLLGTAFLLLFAGYETTMNLLAGGALALLERPQQLRRLAAGEVAWDRVVEELLRLVSPLECATWRHTARQVDVAGRSIPAGEPVLVSLAAANHDPDEFDDPAGFDPDRGTARHLAFGYGPHTCAGAHLARAEAEIALGRLFARFPHLRLTAGPEDLPWRPGLLVRGPMRLPVRLDDPLVAVREQVAQRTRAGLRRHLVVRGPDEPVLDMASNDYLGLARDPRVTAAAARAATTWGAGATGSRLVTGSTALHAELETALARHAGAQAALVLSSGYLANLAAVTALAGPGSLVVSDALVHASLVDACRLARGRVAVTPHLDVDAVERALAERTEQTALVLTEGVFSVSGNAAPLAALARACRRTGALLVIDEAHSLGVVGEAGRGAAHAAGLAGCSDVVLTATLSKALGSQGGAVLGDQAVVDLLVSTGRAFIFDTALAPAAAAAALAALEAVAGEPDRASAARANARRVAGMARDVGLVVAEPDAAVLSVRIGAPELALAAAEHCREQGVQVGCFRPPSVPDGDSRLRLTTRADLDDEALATVGRALAGVATLLAAAPPAGPSYPGTAPA